MANYIVEALQRRAARVAGLAYLVVVGCGIFAEFFVRARLVVSGDTTATVNNIMAHEGLFRVGVVSDVIAQTCYFLLAIALYMLLRPTKTQLALPLLVSVAVATAMSCLNLLNQFAAVLLLSGADYVKLLGADQLRALVMLFLDLHEHGYIIAGIFFGGWLVPLGLVVYRMGYVPRILCILLMIAGFGAPIDFLVSFLAPSFKAITFPFYAVATVGEVSFFLWLLIKGANLSKAKHVMVQEAMA